MKLRLLKSKRVLKGMYQHEVAKEIGVSHKTYNFKENGKVAYIVPVAKKEKTPVGFYKANKAVTNKKLTQKKENTSWYL